MLFTAPIPAIPDTGWRAPTELPRLEHAPLISIDLETYDPELLTHGPGWGRGVGHIVGVAVGVPDGRRWYFPIRHELPDGRLAPENLPPETVLKWCQRELTRPRQPKVGANLEYDTGWLAHEGVQVQGPLIDVQYAEPLLDEHRRSYSLDSLAETYLCEHKVDEVLYDWLHRAYGGSAGRKQAGNIYRAPVALVGPYAEGDVDLPLRIWEKQQPLLEEQGLLELFRLECDLIPILVQMRLRGIRVDVDKAERHKEELLMREAEIQARLRRLCGFDVNVDASSDLQRAFDAAGIDYPRTAKGNPSFTASFLNACNNELGELIRRQRRLAKARGTFLQGYILDKQSNGKVHGSFHPLRSTDGGTVSGRFSSSSPNWQNLPSRDTEIKKMIRGLCLPLEGEDWYSIDYSQIEYRMFAHYAGDAQLRQAYAQDGADFHAVVGDMLGGGLPRKVVKNFNFMLLYGGGKRKLAEMLRDNLSPEEVDVVLDDALARLSHTSRKNGDVYTDTAEAVYALYLQDFPAARRLADSATARAAERGYIKTILGRRARFPMWESREWSDNSGELPKDAAIAKWGARGIRRSRTHKALNALLQGSAADMLKRAMLDIHQDMGIIPLNTVHDELCWSFPPGKQGEELAREVKRLMEVAILLKIPVVADVERGPDWGDLQPLDL
jgi:DNA polymerase I-like protein with 3'-5' exonuclease and polymerase domains